MRLKKHLQVKSFLALVSVWLLGDDLKHDLLPLSPLLLPPDISVMLPISLVLPDLAVMLPDLVLVLLYSFLMLPDLSLVKMLLDSTRMLLNLDALHLLHCRPLHHHPQYQQYLLQL